MMNPPSYFLFSDDRKDILICFDCHKRSERILYSNPVIYFTHECKNGNFYRTSYSSSSVQLHQDNNNNNVIHLYSSNYYHNEGIENGNTKTNGIK